MRDINIDELRDQARKEAIVDVTKFIVFRTRHFQIKVQLLNYENPSTVYSTIQQAVDSAINTDPYLTSDELYAIVHTYYSFRQITITILNDIYNVETTFTPVRDKNNEK